MLRPQENGGGPDLDPVVKLDCRLQSMSLTHDDLPSELKEGQFDITLLYAEEDRDEALKFKEIIEKFIKFGNQHAKVCTIDQNLTSIRGLVSHLGEAIKRSNYGFLYITGTFQKSKWSELQTVECLMESICNDEKPWFAVPVFTNEHQKKPCQSLTGLRGLKGIDLYHLLPKQMVDVDVDALVNNDFDDGILQNITSMIRKKLPKRFEREKEQAKAIGKWLDDKTNECREDVTNTPSSDEETELYKPCS